MSRQEHRVVHLNRVYTHARHAARMGKMKGLDAQFLGARFIVEGVKMLHDLDDEQANERGQRLLGYDAELQTRALIFGEDTPELRAEIPGLTEPLPPGMELVPEAVAAAEARES